MNGTARWAIWGSALMFGVYHAGWQGVAAIGSLWFGVIFAVIRWRAGGIVGLIIVHGLMDVIASLMLPGFEMQQLRQITLSSPLMLIIGYSLILLVPIYLWKIYHASIYVGRPI